MKDFKLVESPKEAVAPIVIPDSPNNSLESEETKIEEKRIGRKELLSNENGDMEDVGEMQDITFLIAIRYALKDKFSYDMSRSGKAEFWWYALFYGISSILLCLIPYRIVDFLNLYLFVALAFVFVRRLHDSNLSGYWWLLLIPLALSIWGGTIAVLTNPDTIMAVLMLIALTIIPVIWLGIRDSDEYENEYGEPVN